MQFFNLKLSYLRYQVILFSTCSYGTPRVCAFLDCNWDLGVTVHLYQLKHLCNLKLNFLRYQVISYVMCQLMSMSHLFYHNLHVFFLWPILVYLLVFCYSIFVISDSHLGMERFGGSQQTQLDSRNAPSPRRVARASHRNTKENSRNKDAANKSSTIKENLKMLNLPPLQGGRQAQLA